MKQYVLQRTPKGGPRVRLRHSEDNHLKGVSRGVKFNLIASSIRTGKTMTNDKCKHGMTVGTCAICAGLVTPVGELQCHWIMLCDDSFDIDFKKDEGLDQDEWFKTNKRSLINRFYRKWKEKPPIPTWP